MSKASVVMSVGLRMCVAAALVTAAAGCSSGTGGAAADAGTGGRTTVGGLTAWPLGYALTMPLTGAVNQTFSAAPPQVIIDEWNIADIGGGIPATVGFTFADAPPSTTGSVDVQVLVSIGVPVLVDSKLAGYTFDVWTTPAGACTLDVTSAQLLQFTDDFNKDVPLVALSGSGHCSQSATLSHVAMSADGGPAVSSDQTIAIGDFTFTNTFEQTDSGLSLSGNLP